MAEESRKPNPALETEVLRKNTITPQEAEDLFKGSKKKAAKVTMADGDMGLKTASGIKPKEARALMDKARERMANQEVEVEMPDQKQKPPTQEKPLEKMEVNQNQSQKKDDRTVELPEKLPKEPASLSVTSPEINSDGKLLLDDLFVLLDCAEKCIQGKRLEGMNQIKRATDAYYRLSEILKDARAEEQVRTEEEAEAEKKESEEEGQ